MAQPAAVKYKGVWQGTDKSSGTISFAARLYHNSKRHCLGSYCSAEAAAHAYDLAALAFKGPHTETNFPASIYTQADIDAAAQQLRSHTPNVKTSQFVGVRLKGGLWDARVRRDYVRVHLGYFTTEQDAAVQYDLAHIVLHGQDPATCSKTNFDWSDVPAATIDSMAANVRLRMSGKLLPGLAGSEHAAGGGDQQQQQQQPRQPLQQQQQQLQQARGPGQALPQQPQQQGVVQQGQGAWQVVQQQQQRVMQQRQVAQQLEQQQRRPAEQQQQQPAEQQQQQPAAIPYPEGIDSDSSDQAAAQQQQRRQQRRVEKRLCKAERRLKRVRAARREAKQQAKQLQQQLQELQQQVEQLQQQGRSMKQELKAARRAVRAAKQVVRAARQQQQ